MDTQTKIKHDQVRQEKRLLDTDIVPEDYQSILIYLRDSITSACFTIGDVANELVLKSLSVGLPVTDIRVFEAVGRFCGKSARTVRYYAETSAFYTKEVRQEYESLPFSFFVFARSMDNKWKDVLDFAMDNQGSTLDYVRYVFTAPVQQQIDGNKSCETSQDIDLVGDDKFCESSPMTSPQLRGSESSQNYDKQRLYSMISLVSQFKRAANDFINAVSKIEIYDKSMIIQDVERAEKRATEVAKEISRRMSS